MFPLIDLEFDMVVLSKLIPVGASVCLCVGPSTFQFPDSHSKMLLLIDLKPDRVVEHTLDYVAFEIGASCSVHQSTTARLHFVFWTVT